jgi:hypothetical protein
MKLTGPCSVVRSQHFSVKKRFIEIIGEHSELDREKEPTNELDTVRRARVSGRTRGGVLYGRQALQKPGASSPRSEKVSHAPQEKKVAFGQGQTSSKD